MNKRTNIVIKTLMVLSLINVVSCNTTKPLDSMSLSSSDVSITEKETSHIFSYAITFVINGKKVKVEAVNDVFIVPVANVEGKKFVGWSTSENGNNLLFKTEKEISLENVRTFIGNDKELELYARFADIAEVRFVTNNPTTVNVYSIIENAATIEEPYKEGYKFLGWSTKENDVSPTIESSELITYSLLEKQEGFNGKIELYPVFKKQEETIINVYKYNKAEEMAEIHINTDGGIAIDDSSLINPLEHKGKNGELAVYDYVGATISVDHCEDGYSLDSVAGKVKVRGNYTSTYKKKPIRIKFDKKQKMLGLNNDNKLKSWVLLAEWKDSSMLRNAVANHIGNSLLESDGFYCSDFRFVKVYLNNQYNGVYCLVEQQQIDPCRVDIPESKLETDGVNTGYMLEFDGYYKNEASLQQFTIDYSGIKTLTNGFSIVNDINNQEQHDFISKVTQTVWKVVYDATKNQHTSLSTQPYHTMDENGEYIVDTSIKTAEEAVDKVLDIKSLINMYILHEICQDRDIGWSSFYFSIDMSKDGNKKLTFNAPWDFDYAMGNNTYSNAQKASLANQSQMITDKRLVKSGMSYKFSKDTILKASDFSMTNSSALYVKGNDNPWFSIFTSQDWFARKVSARWKEAINAKVFEDVIEMISVLTEKYDTYFNENFAKWSESMGLKLDGYQPSLVSYFVTHKQAAQYLSIWLEARVNGLSKAIQNNYGNK